ncbi:ATP-binding cassette domain-containing protein [Corynebacterium heidelbergense]|uniref:ABC transporter ATP-binding protein n=1 Tax=Corynebacterium heidelbergense TaxID=2055947 RepID=A0A364VDU8_9CORY|nr:ATP-binding cassette domain-containing protein [Corynebacterium heidelbergense]RAV34817.1 ABC transporter ATP-binding protein [Corynebacterium heidelbergense]WCZ37206.1 putative ABC transporter ATP-binding protein YxlF [Corynebacterium heidelbergense]
MITVENLKKSYGGKEVLHGLSFHVPDGQVTGFLGPNGSGKSSTLRCILGLDRPDDGTVLFDGEPTTGEAIAKNRSSVVGALLEPTWYLPSHSAKTHAYAIARAAGLSTERADECLAMVGLTEVASKKIKTFSLGMKQRLGLAIALMGNPKHLLLDEPVNGLDPEGVHWMRGLIRQCAAQGRAVLVSSHLLHEMELTADRVVLIGRGSLLGEHTLSEFLSSAGSAGTTVRLRVQEQQQLMDAISQRADLNIRALPDGAAEISGQLPPQELAHTVGTLARDNGWVVTELTPSRAGLEQRYLDVTQNAVEYRAGKAGAA